MFPAACYPKSRPGVAAGAPPQSGLILWLRDTSIAGLSDGASLSSGNLVDSSPAANTPTAVSGFTKATGVNGRAVYRTAAGTITLPSSLAVSTRNHSVYALARTCAVNAEDYVNGTYVDFGSSPENMFWWNPGQPGLGIYDGSSNVYSAAVLPYNSSFGVHGYRSGASNIKWRVGPWINTGSVTSSASLTGGKIGDRVSGGFPFSGDFCEILIYDHSLSDDEDAALLAYFGANFGAAQKQVVCVGDSITSGVANTGINSSWPWFSQPSLGANVKVINYGIAGTTAQQKAAAAASYAAYTDGVNFAQNLFVLYAGINDLRGGRTAAQVLADITTFCGAIRGAGGKVIVTTLLSAASLDVTSEGYRQTINTALRGYVSGTADGLADIDANTPCGGVGTYANTTYFNGDQLHPTIVGEQALAVEFLRSINALL